MKARISHLIMNYRTNSLGAKVVLLFTLYFPPEIGGGSTGAWNRAMVFLHLGYKVIIVTAFPSYPLGKIDDLKYKKKLYLIEKTGMFTIIRFRMPSLNHNGYIRPLIIFISFVLVSIFYLPLVYEISRKPNLIYARSPVIFASFIGFVYSKILRCDFIYEVPDLWPEELFFRNTTLSNFLSKIGIQIAALSYKLPNKIITVSKAAEKYIIQHYHPKSPVYGIPVGVDLSTFRNVPKAEARIQLMNLSLISSNDLDKCIILYSGRISSAQKIDCLLIAANKLKDNSNILIYIVGEGPDKKRIEKIKADKKLENVIILPAQKRELMPVLISASDICTVFLSPESIFSIALPTKFYEYLACGKPIIGICKGELAEIVTDNQIGETCEIGNCEQLIQVIKKMSNSSEIKVYETNSKNLLTQYSINQLSLKFEKIISI
jgi:glycosyltransferase involved in cell wall biosynthesis